MALLIADIVRFLALSLAILPAGAAHCERGEAQAQPLASYSSALCLDGSAGRYYIRPGSGNGKAKFVIYHEGGGFCTSHADCARRALGSLGSTKDDAPTRCLDTPILSSSKEDNPLLWNWNHVFVRYCDGAYMSGDRVEPINVSGASIHYRGRHITEAVFADLRFRHSLAAATDIVITGCSAGAIRSLAHIDALAAKLPSAARVMAFPDSGFYLDRAMFTPLKHFVVAHDGQNGTALLNHDCVADQPAGQEELCLIGSVVSRYVATPVFAGQSRYDTDQRGCEMSASCSLSSSCVRSYGDSVTSAVQNALLRRSTANGVFLDSCSRHCYSGALPVDDASGLNPMQAFASWYAGNGRWYGQNATTESYPCKRCCSKPARAVFV